MGADPAIFRALIERSPIVTYVADADGAITYISAQITEWTGLPAHLWTDDPTFWRSLIHPDDHERVVAAAFGTEMLDIEYRMRGRDADWLWIWDREVAVVGEGAQGVCLDITPLRETRMALDAARARLAEVVNVAPVILFATDSDGPSRCPRARRSSVSASRRASWSGRRSSSYADVRIGRLCRRRDYADTMVGLPAWNRRGRASQARQRSECRHSYPRLSR